MASSPSQFLLSHFDRLAEAPGGIAKLRALLLRLAVRGSLSEESDGWSETKLATVIRLVSGQHLTPSEYTKEIQDIPYITGPADFGVIYPTPCRWTKERRALALRGDILITVKGAGVGKTNLVDCDELAISRQLMAVRVTDDDTDVGFVHLCLKAAAAHFQNVMVGSAIPGISREDVLDFQFRLPPLAEQRRIVAKVEELMGLCDKLEAAQRERETIAEQLLSSTIAQLSK